MRNGATLVFAANPKYELLAVNSLGAGRDQLLAGDFQRRHLDPDVQTPVGALGEGLTRSQGKTWAAAAAALTSCGGPFTVPPASV